MFITRHYTRNFFQHIFNNEFRHYTVSYTYIYSEFIILLMNQHIAKDQNTMVFDVKRGLTVKNEVFQNTLKLGALCSPGY